VISPDQREAYDRAINDVMDRANRNIAVARRRRLSAAQQQLIDRAISFLQQAQQIRATEPAAAQSLAERAELLSREAISQ
jgi:hypothetical protein